jgi:hypothetical protein
MRAVLVAFRHRNQKLVQQIFRKGETGGYRKKVSEFSCLAECLLYSQKQTPRPVIVELQRYGSLRPKADARRRKI